MAERRAPGAFAGLALLLTASTAGAQSNSDRATALFKEARTLADAGKHVEACPKLEESQRLDPGVGTQFNLADCYEHTRRPATAWRLFREVAAAAHAAGKTEREKAALQRSDLLASTVPQLRITVVDPSAVQVRLDGRLLAANERREPIAVDPGTHVVEVTAPQRQPALITVSLGDHGVVECTVPPLAELERERPPAVNRSGWPLQRTIGAATLAVGLVGTGVGTAFALVARDKRSDVRQLCPAYPACSSSTLGLAESIDSEGRTAAAVATVAFIAGGVAIGTGLSLVLLTPTPAASSGASVRLRLSSSSAVVEGSW